MLLGKGHKFLLSGRYEEALERALKAKNLELEEQFEWLCHSIEGKSRYHLGDQKSALVSLQKAEQILATKLKKEGDSKHLQNILDDVAKDIEKIKSGDV